MVLSSSTVRPRPSFLPLNPVIERPPARRPTFLSLDPVIERPATPHPNFLPLDPVIERPFTLVRRPHTPSVRHREGHLAYPYEMLWSPPPAHSHGSRPYDASNRTTGLRPFSFQSGSTTVQAPEQPDEGKGKNAVLEDSYQLEDTYVNRGWDAYSGEYVTADAILNPPMSPSRTDGGGPGPRTTAGRALSQIGLLATSRPLPPLNREYQRRPRKRSDKVLFRTDYSQMDGFEDGPVEADAESEDGVEEPPKKRPGLASSTEEAPAAPGEGIAEPSRKRKSTSSTTDVGSASTSGISSAAAAGSVRTTVASRMLADLTVRDDEIVDRLLRERDRRDAANIAERLCRRADVATWIDSEADDEEAGKAGLMLAPPDPHLAVSDPSAYTFSSSRFPSGEMQAMYEEQAEESGRGVEC